MKKVSLEDAKDYDAPGHFDVYTGLLHGELFGNKASDLEDFWIGISHFLPGGGCDMSSSENEKVYYMLSGEVTKDLGWRKNSFRAERLYLHRRRRKSH